jgi:hypothetical protein
MPFFFENRVGRLLEVVLEAGMTLEEAQQFRTKMFLALSSLPGRGVLFGDLRRALRFAPDVRDKMLDMLRHDNPKVERTAFLMSDGPFANQVERIVLEATPAVADLKRTAPVRRVFLDKLAARDWLIEVLGSDERARLAEFVDGL